jgi:hypothetical protein
VKARVGVRKTPTRFSSFPRISPKAFPAAADRALSIALRPVALLDGVGHGRRSPVFLQKWIHTILQMRSWNSRGMDAIDGTPVVDIKLHSPVLEDEVIAKDS